MEAPAAGGRTFTDSHRVGAADVDGAGRAHPFALARWLQETAFADGLDSGFGAEAFWIIRRLTLVVRKPPTFPEKLELRTWCSGKAKTVAERSTTIRGDQGGDVDAVAIWVHVDRESRLPARLPEEFERLYGPSAAGRRARSSLRHPGEPPEASQQLEWTFGRAAIDLAGHVSNLWYWELAEEFLELTPREAETVVLEAEFRAGIGAGRAVVHRAGEMLWISAEDGTLAATVSMRTGEPGE